MPKHKQTISLTQPVNHRQGPLPPPPLHQLPHGRRARSPEVGLRRSSSRVGASSPDQGGRGRVLRREKTSVFDSRYPSLDGNQPSNLPKVTFTNDVNKHYEFLDIPPPSLVCNQVLICTIKFTQPHTICFLCWATECPTGNTSTAELNA